MPDINISVEIEKELRNELKTRIRQAHQFTDSPIPDIAKAVK